MTETATDGGTDKKRPEMYQISGWRYLCLIPIALLLRLWFGSLRISIPPPMRQKLSEDPRGVIFILWHNRGFMSAELHRRYRRKRNRLVGLFSSSRDGAWMAALFRMLGVGGARGSSNRRGMAASREILKVLKTGYDTGLTPDGSRGPIYQAKEGIAMLARQSNAPLVFVSPKYHSAWRLKSWDRYFIPKPFSRVECSVEFYDSIEALAPGADRKAAADAITARLNVMGKGSDPEMGL